MVDRASALADALGAGLRTFCHLLTHACRIGLILKAEDVLCAANGSWVRPSVRVVNGRSAERGAGSSARRVLSALLAPVMAFGGMTVPGVGGRKCGGVGGGNRCGQVGTGKRIDDVFGFGTGIPQQRPNGGSSSSAEAAKAAALGCTVTMFSSSAVSGMTTAQMVTYFGGFSASSSGTRRPRRHVLVTGVPMRSTYAADWGPAVNGR